MKRSCAIVLAAALSATLAGCAGGATPPPSTAVVPEASGGAPGTFSQRNEGGEVTVLATWKGPDSGASFVVTLDTHSVDLDALDLSNATLRNDRGELLKARPWAAPKGGHHREGILVFDGDAAGFLAGARWMELVLTGVGGLPERALRWELAT